MSTVTIKAPSTIFNPSTAGSCVTRRLPNWQPSTKSTGQLQAGTISPMKAMPEMVGHCCDLVHLSLSNKYPDLDPPPSKTVENDALRGIQKAVIGVAEVTGLKGKASLRW